MVKMTTHAAIFTENMITHSVFIRQTASGFANLSIAVEAFYDVAYRVLLLPTGIYLTVKLVFRAEREGVTEDRY